MSLRTRLDLMVSGILLLMLLSMLYLSSWRQSQQSLVEQQFALNATTTALAKALKTPLITSDYATIDTISQDVFNHSGLHALLLTDTRGRALANLRTTRATTAVPSWFKRWFNIPAPENRMEITVGGVKYADLHITGNSESLYLSLWTVVTQMSLIALLAYAVLNISVWWILRRGFRPLDLLQHAAEKLAKGIREPIDEEKVAPELRLPIQAFNQMSEEISRLISELLEKQTDLQISAQAIESLNEGVIILKRDMGIKYCNPFAVQLHTTIPTLLQTLTEILQRHLSQNPGASLHLATDVSAAGSLHTLDILINSVNLPHSTDIYHVVVVRDITEERIQKTKLAWEATHDTLTGILNRLEFARRLNEHISSGQPGMLLFIDIDHFKRINDSYGHSVGDQMLKHLAEGLQRSLGEDALLARFSGDEFLVLLKHISLEEGTRLTENLLAAIPAMKLLYHGHLFSVTASVGGIYFDANTNLSAEMLISHTDATMFEAKRAGRNRLAIFAHEMPEMENIRVDQEWLDRLTSALEQKRIFPYFQPILRLEDDNVSHYESLARMEDGGKILDAFEFIPHAERLGLIGEIDVIMLRGAMRVLSESDTLVLASNLSGYTLNNPHLRKRLFEVIDEFASVASRLILEITESTAIEEIGDAREFIHVARAKGCHFAIDDFGVGYSSLQMLSQLDVDYLKIDGSLLANLHSENTALLKAVQGLADALQIPTVAEHVDSEQKLETVRRVGIQFAQGYWIGKAISPYELKRSTPDIWSKNISLA